MSLRERVLIPRGRRRDRRDADSALFEPILRATESQFAEHSAARGRDSHHADAGAGVRPGANGRQRKRERQRLEKRRVELAALDRQLAAGQSELVPPERMAKMLSEIVKANPDIELISLRSLLRPD